MNQLTNDHFLQVEKKLAEQERKIRLLKWGYLLCLIVLIALPVFSLAEARNDRWEGKAISLRDDHGEVRAKFEIKNDIPRVALYDRKGTDRLELRLTP